MPEPFREDNAGQLRDVFRNKIVHRIFNYVVPINEKDNKSNQKDWHWYMFNPNLSDDEFTMLRKIAGDRKNAGYDNVWNHPKIRCQLWKDKNGIAMDIVVISKALCATVLEQYKKLAS